MQRTGMWGFLAVAVCCAVSACSAPSGGDAAGGGSQALGGGSAAGGGASGGGTGGDQADGGPTDDGGVLGGDDGGTGDALVTATTEVTTFVQSVWALSHDERRAAILAFLQARPDFSSVSVSPDGVRALFGEFAIPFMVFDNREADPDGGLSELVPRNLELPSSSQARLINALGDAFADDTTVIGPLLNSRGYLVAYNHGGVEDFRRISGDGVLYVSSHGGACQVPIFLPDGGLSYGPDKKFESIDTFGLWTSTPVTLANVPTYLADLRAGKLGVGVAPNRLTPDKKQAFVDQHYWLTGSFVADHWSLTPDSMVWISACSGQSEGAADFSQAIFNVGGGAYFGWSAPVNASTAIKASAFVFDRLLGANTVSPKEDPPQRPFDLGPVWSDLTSRGFDHSTSVGGPTVLSYTQAPGSNFALLAPTLSRVLIDEAHDQAVLVGLFGTPPLSDQRVQINGQDVTIAKWTETRVTVQLARSGPASSGEVIASVRNHPSNPRHISQWLIPMQYQWGLSSLAPLQVTGPLQLRLRADVGETRAAPHTTPDKPVRFAGGARDSQAVLTASGSRPNSDCTDSYSGAATLLEAGFDTISPVIGTFGRFDVPAKQLSLGLFLGLTTPPWTYTETCPTHTISAPFAPTFGLFQNHYVEFDTPLEDGSGGVSLPAMGLTLGDDFTVQAGNSVESVGDLTIRFTWSSVPAQSAPDPMAAR